MYYSSIDLHKNMSVIISLNYEGKIISQQKMPNDDYIILNYFFFAIGKQHKAVVECTSNCYWELLNDHGIDLTLTHTKYLKAIS